MKRATRPVMRPAAAGHFRMIGGQRVPEVFCGRVHGRATDVLPILARGVASGRQGLCGQAFVAQLTTCQRQQVDACLADMAVRGALPLEHGLDDAGSPPRYRLVGGAQ